MGITCYRGRHRLLYHKFCEDKPLHMISSYRVGHEKVAPFCLHLHLATVFISVFMLSYGHGLRFRGPLCTIVLEISLPFISGTNASQNYGIYARLSFSQKGCWRFLIFWDATLCRWVCSSLKLLTCPVLSQQDMWHNCNNYKTDNFGSNNSPALTRLIWHAELLPPKYL